MRPLRQLEGSADNDQLVEKVSELLRVPDELTAIPHKSGPQIEIGYRISWVKSWLKWAGMRDNPQRGIWVLTVLGRVATEAEIKAARSGCSPILPKGRRVAIDAPAHNWHMTRRIRWVEGTAPARRDIRFR